MESKTMSASNFGTLLINRLASKKNWFVISFAVLLLTVVVLPLLMTGSIKSENIVIGMIEIFIIVFVNCILDLSYLHDNRKLAYYTSKPITVMQGINLHIVTNVVLTAVLLIVLLVINLLTGMGTSSYLTEMYTVAIPWLLYGIFVAALSSILTGNTIAAAIATVFNFALPATLLAIFYFIFDIVQDLALGLSASILMESFVNNYYKIDYLYLIRFADEGIRWSYFIIIAAVVGVLYLLTRRLLKRRKNERAGDFIVYNGYRNFITVLIGSLIPIGFITVVDRGSLLSRIISFVLLSALTYYIISAILEKSFKLNKSAYKIYAGFISLFLLAVLLTNIGANRLENYTPDLAEVKSVYLGDNTWVALKYKDEGEQAIDIEHRYYEEQDRSEQITVPLQQKYPLYSEPQEIQSIIDLQKSIIADQSYWGYEQVVFTYIMKDGKNLIRVYTLQGDDNYTGEKDDLVKGLLNGKNYKEKHFPFVYDDDFSHSLDIKQIQIEDEQRQSNVWEKEEVDILALREALQKDYDANLAQSPRALRVLTQSKVYTDVVEYEDSEVDFNKISQNDEYYNIRIYTYASGDIYFFIDSKFENTFSLLEQWFVNP